MEFLPFPFPFPLPSPSLPPPLPFRSPSACKKGGRPASLVKPYFYPFPFRYRSEKTAKQLDISVPLEDRDETLEEALGRKEEAFPPLPFRRKGGGFFQNLALFLEERLDTNTDGFLWWMLLGGKGESREEEEFLNRFCRLDCDRGDDWRKSLVLLFAQG